MTTHARTTDGFDYFWEREPSDVTGIWAYLDAKPLPRRDFGSVMPERDEGFRFAHVDLDDIEVIEAPVAQAPSGSTCDNATCTVEFEEEVCDELTFCSRECAEGYLLQTA